MTDLPPPPELTSRDALFLDFDGTLVALAPTPDAVAVGADVHDALWAANATVRGALAIITGRTIDDVTGHLGDLAVPVSGSHGNERRWPDGRREQPGEEVRQTAEAIRSAVRDRLADDADGLIFESKDWSAAVHYRQRPDREGACRKATEAVVSRYSDWEVLRGDMILEARLKGPSKASAVRSFMEEAPFSGRSPVFVGDDVTDEDGMRAAMDCGGYGVKVGTGESVAAYRLPGPEAVIAWLGGAKLTSAT